MTFRAGQARIQATYHIHRMLWGTAEHLRDIGVLPNGKLSDQHAALSASVMAYFAMEAYLNSVGPLLRADIWVREREFFANGKYRGTLGKLEFLIGDLSLSILRGKRPLNTIRELDRRRSSVVHARTEREDRVVSFSHPSRIGHRAPTHLKLADPRFVVKVFEDIEAVCDLIQAAARERLGERKYPWPRAFRGASWVRGGNIIRQPRPHPARAG